ncbi:glutathione S-transferase 1 [[Candida] railenensis]|uniref:Glutathione S-transferase 1 n=1 Tax=[Candida] railenensis TaxID=45579 RepID=A0A9P0QMX2_9ASCO|nr:glutathione S-transferase 1 [[Candida] railenensis]
MTQEKIILHWLNFSRAHRVLWLLEELEVPYELKLYERDEDYRAPPQLKKIHQLGRSPILEIYPDGNEDPIILAETGYIMSYILENYNPKGKLVPESKRNQELVKYYLYYAEGTLQGILVSLYVLGETSKRAPWGGRTIGGLVAKGISKGYYLPEAFSNLDFLEEQLSKQPGGYFAGDKLSAADIILSFPLNDDLFSNRAAMNRVGSDISSKYPNIKAWRKRIVKEPGLIRANEIIKKDL